MFNSLKQVKDELNYSKRIKKHDPKKYEEFVRVGVLWSIEELEEQYCLFLNLI